MSAHLIQRKINSRFNELMCVHQRREEERREEKKREDKREREREAKREILRVLKSNISPLNFLYLIPPMSLK